MSDDLTVCGGCGETMSSIQRDLHPCPQTANGTLDPASGLDKISGDRSHLIHLTRNLHAHGGAQPWLTRLDTLTSIMEQAELLRAKCVAEARLAGHSWSEVGQQIGMTKQAAQQRYGAKPKKTMRTDPDQLSLTD